MAATRGAYAYKSRFLSKKRTATASRRVPLPLSSPAHRTPERTPDARRPSVLQVAPYVRDRIRSGRIENRVGKTASRARARGLMVEPARRSRHPGYGDRFQRRPVRERQRPTCAAAATTP